MFFCLPSFGTYSYDSSFCLILCVCIRSAVFLGLETVILYSRCPVLPRSTIAPGHQNHFLQRWPLFSLYVFFCYGWSTVAGNGLMDEACPLHGCQQWLVTTLISLVCKVHSLCGWMKGSAWTLECTGSWVSPQPFSQHWSVGLLQLCWWMGIALPFSGS